jgi:hypothetical protein
MAGCTGQSIFIELTIYGRILRQRAAQNANWIVAAVAVPGELNALRPRENVYARSVKRRSK